ncbi:MAG: type I-C CRISPR-associated protein Cas8c/Csd1 [Oscillospiraceae bacterium]|nr:type I-C CRISPR-associated protein Cas8c/Csd1 [Oscillospiraceae bacterium]
MGLLEKACETYDAHRHLIGVPDATREPLAPISHMIQKAQLEITLDANGAFLAAEAVVSAKDALRDETKTIIPATESSAGRTSGICSHPLCDNLTYLAPNGGEAYKAYVEQLTDWAASPYTHPKVRAVLNYVCQGTILEDLSRAKRIELDESGNFPEKHKKDLVRWRVVNTGERDACWEDPSLFQAFIDYYRSVQVGEPKDFCMISGQLSRCTGNHPKGVVPASNGAKLISANDSSGFTYRGRFTESRQAATIGYEASQKAHSALRWVVANQGVALGGRTFVCWNPKGNPVPNPAKNPMRPKHAQEKLATPTEYREQLANALKGWREALPDFENVIIAAFDAATTGRLSITYYNELRASDFLDRLADWQLHCCWENNQFGYQSPSIRQIVTCAYGVQRGNFLEVDDRVMREQVQRLMHCVIDRAAIGQDLVRMLAQRASTPQAYDKNNWTKILFTACAVIKAYREKQKGETWKMAYEFDRKDRSYQFGGLLAVLEKVERDTYDASEDREPNAIRMQTVFSERPMYAARIINDRLLPYFARLRPASRTYYKQLIGTIMATIDAYDTTELNRRLEDSYLMGYYLMRKELYTSKKGYGEDEKNERSGQ